MPQPSPDFLRSDARSDFRRAVPAPCPTPSSSSTWSEGSSGSTGPSRPCSPESSARGDSIADALDPAARALVHDMIVNAEMTGGAVAEHRWQADLYPNHGATGLPVSAPVVLVVFKNITGIRNAGQTIVDLVRDRSDFLAAVSDQLRTPLTAVVGYASLRAEPKVDARR